jgi:cobyrinic acid a,c-diamide synthase
MAGSAAAVVHGFDTLAPEVHVAAMVANFVAGAGHYEYLRDAIAARCSVPAAGYLPREASLHFPERHLGLHLAEETLTAGRLGALAECVERHIDLDLLLRLSDRPREELQSQTPLRAPRADILRAPRARVGVARDAAFCFYYQDNLDLLRECGAKLVAFSPLADRALPEGLDGIYFGGGYPELHAETLARNAAMRRSVAEFVANDGVVYAECGGFMYLTEAIVDGGGCEWPMAGVFPTKARMQSGLAKLGYVEVQTGAGIARGHEYRHSTIDEMQPGIERENSGYRVREAFGSYVHLHFLSCPRVAEAFVDACEKRHSR